MFKFLLFKANLIKIVCDLKKKKKKKNTRKEKQKKWNEGLKKNNFYNFIQEIKNF